MRTFPFAALTAGLLLQSLAHPANAPAHVAIAGNPGPAAQSIDRPALTRVDDSGDYFLLPDLNDRLRNACDPEDDCPRG